MSDSEKPPPFALLDFRYIAETRQGGFERTCQRGCDDFRFNAVDSWEEGEWTKFGGVSNCLAISHQNPRSSLDYFKWCTDALR